MENVGVVKLELLNSSNSVPAAQEGSSTAQQGSEYRRPVAIRHWPPGTGPNKQRKRAVAVRTWADGSVGPRVKKPKPNPLQDLQVKPIRMVSPKVTPNSSSGTTSASSEKPSVGKLEKPYMQSSGDRARVQRALKQFSQLRTQMTAPAALHAMNLRNERVNHGLNRLGNVPGVEVGDTFSYRAELCVIGLHKPSQAGISWVGADNNKYGKPVADSVVLSGGYEDDQDNGDTFIYTGSGGNNSSYCKDKGDKAEDQELKNGNLGLLNAMQYKTPVRVIRGFKDDRSPSKKTFRYDGLYNVTGCKNDVGSNGCMVFYFTMVRCPGQAPLGPWLTVENRNGKRKKKLS